jgi:hypothetical protein
MVEDVVALEPLRHNPLNEVTAAVERITDSQGHSRVRKALRRPGPEYAPGPWAASTAPRAWNYWHREADAYQDEELRGSLKAAGLAMPEARVEETAAGATLWLEDVEGTPGTAFSLDDHVALAEAHGRWQARGPLVRPWTSSGFLRDYSTSRPAAWHLVDDDDAWRQPLIADLWPVGLREGWRRLLAVQDTLLDVMERLPRTRSHLDLWVSNEIRRGDGTVVLLDWAFVGDGAIGEDLGNHLPDAVFDLFWPAERLPELEQACCAAYEGGLREEGWTGDARLLRLGVVASAVKYAWLLPRLLASASAQEHQAYHQGADPEHLYRQRGLALWHLVGWCDEALSLLA